MTEDEQGVGGELPPDAFVVRAGTMVPCDLRRNVENHYFKVLTEEGREEWGMSVYCLPGESVEEIARRARKRHGKICVSTVGEIYTAGYDVRSDWQEDGHSNIMFDSEPTDEDLRAVKSVFSDAVPNPHPVT